ncbi:hypothetical protein O9363_18005, partial [Proteus vulgaris]|uniref:ImcF-related family protein n=1 Tax=Proteus vulgaris TaxID=585 RepID=UPI00257520AD
LKDFRTSDTTITTNTAGKEQRAVLNPLLDATLDYGNYREKSDLFFDLGLYQGKNVGQYVENVYLQLITEHYLP